MAATQSTPFVHTGFQQALDSWFGSRLDLVDRLFVRYNFQPMDCVYAHPHFEYACGDPASVSDLKSQQPLCSKHFRRVEMDRGLARLEAQ